MCHTCAHVVGNTGVCVEVSQVADKLLGLFLNVDFELRNRGTPNYPCSSYFRVLNIRQLPLGLFLQYESLL